ncbi:MAG: hypothetical protein KAH84_04570 [Thiomargarita sp.]|nr:hypothetical protein [Thiomargarita sp.]
MQSNFDISCAVPRTGRTFENFLNRLKILGINSSEIDTILAISKQSKSASHTDFHQASKFLHYASQQIPCFGLFIDRKRQHRPYRVGFLGYEWKLGDISIRIEGEEPHNGSSLIRLDEIDCAVVGLDELLTMTQYYLHNPTLVTKWGMYNYNIEKPTGIRIAGSAQLTRYNPVLKQNVQDMVGFFLISKPKVVKKAKTIDIKNNAFLNNLAKNGQRVFVKGRYVGIVKAAYPDLKLISVEDVEDAITESEVGSVGLEIVQTGNTLRRKGLVLNGSPLFLSESLYVVDYYRYMKNSVLQTFINKLEPKSYFDQSRIKQFAFWYLALEKNMGDAWINKPNILDLFCDTFDSENGLRPYRLQTRHWKPHDFYKQDEAIAQINAAKVKLQDYYQTYK